MQPLMGADDLWPCTRGAMCFAACPGCPYAAGERPLPMPDDKVFSPGFAQRELDRRAEWRRYLMGFAEHAATKSKDTTKVGAILVDDENTVLLSGYNGPPRGVRDLPERRVRPLKYYYAAHAEQNLVSFAARKGVCTDGCTVYVTHLCCSGCTKSLIQAGIRKVVYGPGKTSMPAEEFGAARTMFEEAGVVLEAFNG